MKQIPNCKVVVSDNNSDTESVRVVEDTRVQMYDSGYLYIEQIELLLPPHRIIGVEPESKLV